jgi:hypothetical protein
MSTCCMLNIKIAAHNPDKLWAEMKAKQTVVPATNVNPTGPTPPGTLLLTCTYIIHHVDTGLCGSLSVFSRCGMLMWNRSSTICLH